MAIRHGVLAAAWETHDWTVLSAAAASVILIFALTAFFNYTYDWKFSSTAVAMAALFATLSIVFLSFIDRNWRFNPQENGINAVDLYGSILLLLAAIIITALAVALSARFNIMVTLAVCVGIFLLGLVSDYVFGRHADTQLWAKICYFLLPNLQMFWISDAIYEESAVPLKYIFISGSYALCYTTAILATAIALFQRRQVG
jgi:UDP-N-acetylmuramyl pentapeptide phosphotransferase/UDP-N-acetylglucosamine-1-phosphate transferase